jgi:hypothetical protein
MRIIVFIIAILISIIGSLVSDQSQPWTNESNLHAAPTVDTLPTRASAQLPPLEDCLLGSSDFGVMAEYYPDPPYMVDNTLEQTGLVDYVLGIYESTVAFDNSLYFTITVFDGSINASNYHKEMIRLALPIGSFLIPPNSIDLPSPNSMMRLEDGTIVMMYVSGNIDVFFFTEEVINRERSSIVTLLYRLGAAQYEHLKKCGYIHNNWHAPGSISYIDQ